jgi:hypothetical protein
LSPPKTIIVSKTRKPENHVPKFGRNVIEEEAYKKQFNGELLEIYIFIDTQTPSPETF